MLVPNKQELAWAAGFYDGEGCTCLHSRTDRNGVLRLSMSISQVDIRPLHRFQEAVLGFGSICFRNKAAKSTHSDIYVWQEQRPSRIFQIVPLLWNFLSEPKREQIERCLSEYKKSPYAFRKPGNPGKVKNA
jgi:hypothetical protein